MEEVIRRHEGKAAGRDDVRDMQRRTRQEGITKFCALLPRWSFLGSSQRIAVSGGTTATPVRPGCSIDRPDCSTNVPVRSTHLKGAILSPSLASLSASPVMVLDENTAARCLPCWLATWAVAGSARRPAGVPVCAKARKSG